MVKHYHVIYLSIEHVCTIVIIIHILTVQYPRFWTIIVRKLRQPFFKIEDKSRQYRPIIYETTKWPSPNLNCSFKQSPFDVRIIKDSADGVSASSNADSDVDTGIDDNGGAVLPYEDEKRPGFCEPCSVRYEDLKTVSLL